MNRIGFVCAVTAATLFGVGGTFAQFLFQHRGVSIDWLVTMRLLCAGSALLAISAIKQGRGILGVIDGGKSKGIEDENGVAWRK